MVNYKTRVFFVVLDRVGAWQCR